MTDGDDRHWNEDSSLTRRNTLKFAGGLATIASLPTGVASASDTKETSSVNNLPSEITRLLPQPKHVTYHDSRISIGPRALVATTKVADPTISQLTIHLHQWGVTEGTEPVKVVSPEEIEDTPILFVVDTKGGTPAIDEYLNRLNADVLWSELRTEGYTLEIGRGPDNQKIVVMSGSTWDGVYNALQTLRQLVTTEYEQYWLPEVSIDDYPAPYQYRGVIEGFYGPPWSHEQRLSIIDFLGDYKLNTYIYAPKDDPYHRAKWRVPYPPERKKEIGELATLAKQNYVEFMFSISPGVDITYSSDEDFQALVDKTDAMRDIGADSFALLLDDIVPELTGPDAERFDTPAEAQTYLINRYDDYLKSKDPEHRLYVVPTDYYQAGNTQYRATFAEKVNDDVIIGWTGVGVTDPEITNAEAERVRDVFDHQLLTWDNYPVNDYNRNNLFLGPIRNRSDSLYEHGVTGFVSNPMNEGEASKIPILTYAEYLWNPNTYSPDATGTGDESVSDLSFTSESTWERAIRKLVGGDAYRPMRKFADNTQSSFLSTSESPLLRSKIETFWEQYGTSDSTAELDEEFDNLVSLQETLHSELENELLLDDLNPWLSKLRLLSLAGKSATRMLRTQSVGSSADTVWQQRFEMERRAGHAAENPKEVTEGTISGFLDEARAENDEWLGIGTGTNVFPYRRGQFITSMGNYDGFVPENAVDSDLTTFYWSDRSPGPGDYVGIDLGETMTIDTIRIDMANFRGDSVRHDDYLHNGRIEVSTDGDSWTEVGTITDQPQVFHRIEPTTAQYVRLVATEGQKFWVQVREFMVGTTPDRRFVTSLDHYTTDRVEEITGVEPENRFTPEMAVDDDLSTFFWSNELPDEGDFVGIDLGETKTFGAIRIEMANFTGQFDRESDFIRKGRVEISKDGDSWTTVASVSGQPTIVLSPLDIGTVEAKYVRLVATQGQDSSVQVREFTVDTSAVLPATVSTNIDGLTDRYRIIDGRVRTALSAPDVPSGSTVTVRLENLTDSIKEILLLQDPDAYLTSAVLEYATDDNEWRTLAKVDSPFVSASIDGEPVRAIRVRALSAKESAVAIHEVIGRTDT